MDEQNKSFTSIFELSMAREERHSKRILNVLVLVLVLWFCTIAGFIWYITLPVEETSTEYTQEMEDVDGSDISQHIGDTHGESKADSQKDL